MRIMCRNCHKKPKLPQTVWCWECEPVMFATAKQRQKAYWKNYYETVVRPAKGWKRRYNKTKKQ